MLWPPGNRWPRRGSRNWRPSSHSWGASRGERPMAFGAIQFKPISKHILSILLWQVVVSGHPVKTVKLHEYTLNIKTFISTYTYTHINFDICTSNKLQSMLPTRHSKLGLLLGEFQRWSTCLGEVGALVLTDFSNVCNYRDQVDVSTCLKNSGQLGNLCQVRANMDKLFAITTIRKLRWVFYFIVNCFYAWTFQKLIMNMLLPKFKKPTQVVSSSLRLDSIRRSWSDGWMAVSCPNRKKIWLPDRRFVWPSPWCSLGWTSYLYGYYASKN